MLHRTRRGKLIAAYPQGWGGHKMRLQQSLPQIRHTAVRRVPAGGPPSPVPRRNTEVK